MGFVESKNDSNMGKAEDWLQKQTKSTMNSRQKTGEEAANGKNFHGAWVKRAAGKYPKSQLVSKSIEKVFNMQMCCGIFFKKKVGGTDV
jgi:hypothetical protein